MCLCKKRESENESSSRKSAMKEEKGELSELRGGREGGRVGSLWEFVIARSPSTQGERGGERGILD